MIINKREYGNTKEMKDMAVKSKCKKIYLQYADASKEALDVVVNILKEIEETFRSVCQGHF